MTQKQTWIFAAIGIALVAAAVLGIRGCIVNKTVVVQPPTYTQRIIDSVKAREQLAQTKADSLENVIQKQKKEKDSFIVINDRQQSKLQVASVQVKSLVKQVEIYRGYKDTLAQLKACDTLIPVVTQLTQEVDKAGEINRALRNSFDSLYGSNSLKMALLDYNYTALKENFDNVTANALKLEKSNQKLSKKKRFALGISAGAGVVGGKSGVKLGYFLGPSITYSLVRF